VSGLDESVIQHAFPRIAGGVPDGDRKTFCGIVSEPGPLTDKPMCCKCFLTLIAIQGKGFTATREETIDTAHAVALERRNAVKWLGDRAAMRDRRAVSFGCMDPRGIEHRNMARTYREIARLLEIGAHNTASEAIDG
jgi:hypothetical protein